MNPFFALLCACPPASEPGDIARLTCSQNFGQVQKIILQRTYNGTVLNQIAMAASAAELQATWEALQDATDNTKVVWSNTLGNPEFTPGEAITFGSGNQVPDGIPIVVGREGTSITGTMYSYTQDVILQMKAWQCEELSVFLVNKDGQIGGLVDAHTSPAQFRGIPVQRQTFFVGDKRIGGHAEPDQNALSFNFDPNWSDYFHILTPQFDALAGLYD